MLKAEGLGDLAFVNQAESSGAMADARALMELLEKPVLAGSLRSRGVCSMLAIRN